MKWVDAEVVGKHIRLSVCATSAGCWQHSLAFGIFVYFALITLGTEL